MLMKKTCKYCHNEFETTLERKLFCSKKCKYAHTIRRRAKGVLPVEKICPVCEKPFLSNSGSTKVYCSRHCKAQKFIKRLEKVVLNMRFCLYCGNEFIPKRSNHRICSQECSDLYYRKKKPKPRTWTPLVKPCEYCGAIFKQKQKTQKYCSPKCKQDDNHRRSRKMDKKGDPAIRAHIDKAFNGDMIPESKFRRCCHCGSEMIYIGFDQCPVCRGVYDGKRMRSLYGGLSNFVS